MQTKQNSADIVTKVDKECETIILNLLKKNFPNYGIIAEESANGKEKDTIKISMEKPVWCVDPIDGTTNFYHGLPFVAVCIGLRYKDTAILGIVLNPIINEMFYAMKGKGAFVVDTSQYVTNSNINDNNNNKKNDFKYNSDMLKNSRSISTSNVQFVNEKDSEMISDYVKMASDPKNKDKNIEISIGLQKAVILTEVGYARSNGWVNSVLRRLDILLLEEKVRGIRMLGSCALNMCAVACGRGHIFFEGKNSKWGPKPWDFTAAQTIVEEAGGCVCMPDSVLKYSSKDATEYIKAIPFDCTKGRVLCCCNISAVQAFLDLKLYLPEEEYNDDEDNDDDNNEQKDEHKE